MYRVKPRITTCTPPICVMPDVTMRIELPAGHHVPSYSPGVTPAVPHVDHEVDPAGLVSVRIVAALVLLCPLFRGPMPVVDPPSTFRITACAAATLEFVETCKCA